jgi:hypothetical protein
MVGCSLYEQREEALKKLLEEVRLLLGHIKEWARCWIYHAAFMAVRERRKERTCMVVNGLPLGETQWFMRG